MLITSSYITIGVWIIAAVIAIVSISAIVYKAAYDGPDKMIWWRGAKLLAAWLGIVSVVLALAAFEKLIRELNDDSGRYLNEQFLDLKFYTTTLRAIACAKDMSDLAAKNECFDFSNLDNQVTLVRLHSGTPLTPPTNWQHNPHLDDVVVEITRRFADMNRAMAVANEKPILTFEVRTKLAFLALILFILALALTIGDATYQYCQEKAKLRNH
jgi:hypothetical protein